MSRSGPVTKDTSTVALGLAQIRIGNSATNISEIAPKLAASDSIGALASTKYAGNVDFWKLESGFPLLEDLTIPLRETAMLECEFKEISSFNLALARGIDPLGAVSAAVSYGMAVAVGDGDTTGVITVTDAGGVVSETYTVVFSGADAGDIYGTVSGLVHTFTDVSSIMAPDNGGNPYFSIVGGFFSNTWAADDTYTFSTTAAAAGSVAYADVHAGEIKLGEMTSPDYVRMEAVYTYPNGTNHMYIIFPRANVVSSVELDLQAEDNAAVAISIESKRADSEVTGGDIVWDDKTLGRILFD